MYIHLQNFSKIIIQLKILKEDKIIKAKYQSYPKLIVKINRFCFFFSLITILYNYLKNISVVFLELISCNYFGAVGCVCMCFLYM